MITDEEKWHYLNQRSTSKHDRDFYYLNCFHSYSTGKKNTMHYEIFKNHDYCYLEIPNEDNKI